jgi:hypothetical protein
MSMFIVEKGTPGFSVGRSLDKTGWLCSDTAELVLDNVRLGPDALLGEQDKGFYALMKNLQTERIALAADNSSSPTSMSASSSSSSMPGFDFSSSSLGFPKAIMIALPFITAPCC